LKNFTVPVFTVYYIKDAKVGRIFNITLILPFFRQNALFHLFRPIKVEN